jgi:hypothetical protein
VASLEAKIRVEQRLIALLNLLMSADPDLRIRARRTYFEVTFVEVYIIFKVQWSP